MTRSGEMLPQFIHACRATIVATTCAWQAILQLGRHPTADTRPSRPSLRPCSPAVVVHLTLGRGRRARTL